MNKCCEGCKESTVKVPDVDKVGKERRDLMTSEERVARV